MPSISDLKGKSCNKCRVINISHGCVLAFQSHFPCVRCAALAQWDELRWEMGLFSTSDSWQVTWHFLQGGKQHIWL